MYIIASCQTGYEDVDFHFATQAVLGGAVMLRTQNITRLKKVNLPIIGLKKIYGGDVYITPTTVEIDAVYNEGAQYVAIDCTLKNNNAEYLTKYAHDKGLGVVADIMTVHDIRDFECDYIATTFSPEPADAEFVKDVVSMGFDVIAEGGYTTIPEVKAAITAGASFVCVGTWFENLVMHMVCNINESIVSNI